MVSSLNIWPSIFIGMHLEICVRARDLRTRRRILGRGERDIACVDRGPAESTALKIRV